MPARSRLTEAVAALAAALLAGPPAASLAKEGAPDPERLQISIEFPVPGQRVGDVDGRTLVSGRVLAFTGRLDLYEMIFAIDVSGSTADPSGIDVDGDGEAKGRSGMLRRVFGGGKKGAADNILGAEIAAARALLDELDSRTTRVGLVTFSGDALQGTPDALVEVPLTNDYNRVRKGLEEVALIAPEGATNMADGLRTALAQLRSKPKSDAQAEPQRFIVFLTDGEPMLPYKSTTQVGNEALAIARKAAERGVRILSFAVGPGAVDRPKYPSDMAEITNGRFVAVRDLSTLSTEVASVSFTKLASLSLRNRTLDQAPACQIVTPEGRFAALLPARPGANTLEVRARSTLETEESADVSVELVPGMPLAAELDDALREDLLRLRAICERPPSQRGVEIQTED
jgi:hypothetical protein